MTFIIKHRGSPTARTFADYYCEDHGRFELDVERTAEGDAPDVMPCPAVVSLVKHNDGHGWHETACGKPSVWCISAPMAKVRPFEAIKGGWQKPEHKTWTDTRALGEGQALYDWKEDRAKVWEEKRKADVMKFAKEH